MQTTPKLGALVTHAKQFIAPPQATLLNGRKYSKTSKSEEMLFDALEQPTLEAMLRSMHRAVKEGANINQKIGRESLLYRIGYYKKYERDFAPLTEAAFRLGAKVDNKEHQGGSPLHDALFYRGPLSKKISAVEIYTKFGANVNHLNDDWATPLDFAEYFDSNKDNKEGTADKIVSALRTLGAVHGFGYYSPQDSQSVLSMPSRAVAIAKTGTEAMFRRASISSQSKEIPALFELLPLKSFASFSLKELEEEYNKVPPSKQLDFLAKIAVSAQLKLASLPFVNSKLVLDDQYDADALRDQALRLYIKTSGILDITCLLQDLIPRCSQYLDKTKTSDAIIESLITHAGARYIVDFTLD